MRRSAYFGLGMGPTMAKPLGSRWHGGAPAAGEVGLTAMFQVFRVGHGDWARWGRTGCQRSS